jgi:hypothetical protein
MSHKETYPQQSTIITHVLEHLSEQPSVQYTLSLLWKKAWPLLFSMLIAWESPVINSQGSTYTPLLFSVEISAGSI